MTAGTGVTHSEFNPTDQDTHLLQIWIHPAQRGLTPSYEQHDFTSLKHPNALTLLASQTGKDDSLTVNQDIQLHGGLLEKNHTLHYSLELGRHGWVQVVKGALDVNGYVLQAGDGAAIDDVKLLTLSAEHDCEFLLFDLA